MPLDVGDNENQHRFYVFSSSSLSSTVNLIFLAFPVHFFVYITIQAGFNYKSNRYLLFYID